ncbi:hypothetical protein [Methylobacterium sp. V23]|uniref:hypothetical protein n=1 Tax=Methylobacterium sp. V23 TaxID=2044878 RepID=UPI000CDA4D1A|nr:hypothetical protein [Methylobacterium sp. V23]POR40017.1 hypothetical protein CRT23_26180 [Methylobacterium sp. V23]
MAKKGSVLKIPASDKWSIDLETHPTEPNRWCLVIRLNGGQLFSGGRFRTAKAAQTCAAGSLRVRQAIHYGAMQRADDEMSKE